MADTDCLACTHTTHRDKICATCGCKGWQRADHFTAKALQNINNALMGPIGDMLADMAELFNEQFPEARARVVARREELIQKMKEEKEKHDSPATTGVSQPVNAESDSSSGGVFQFPTGNAAAADADVERGEDRPAEEDPRPA